MVVPPGDVPKILDSDRWKEFISVEGKGQHDYLNYLSLYPKESDPDRVRKSFVADIALRQLIAEHIRGDHHERGKLTLELHPYLRRLVDDDDSVAFNTITDLGVGHGLLSGDISDERRFPQERDILGDKVNVRFLVRLLRIGDLLDVSTKRAAPMSRAAVAPLPLVAVPHWNQYSAKTHENITPKTIEFTFECKDQEAHRVLRDWFDWLAEEVRHAGLEQMHAARHEVWKAPRCITQGSTKYNIKGNKTRPTINITPASDAKYRFHDWKLELDHEQVFQRLIFDTYNDPHAFIRELLQNALDATRCKLYADYARLFPGKPLPQRPTEFPAEFREKFPIKLSLSEEQVSTSADLPPEKRLVFRIEDHGLGMNEHIIINYFLQIGRSYYRTNEFREKYSFEPTSRFGVGFLSVFASSRNIVVETAQANTEEEPNKGLRLTLREPRSYISTESWTPFEERPVHSRTGTRISIVMEDWKQDVSLQDLVRHWCVATEVPILINNAGVTSRVDPLRFVDGQVLRRSKLNDFAKFVIRTFPIVDDEIEGQIAVIAYEDEQGDGWSDCWSDIHNLEGARVDELPADVEQFIALHGIRINAERILQPIARKCNQWLIRADVRAKSGDINLARSELSGTASSPYRRTGPEDNATEQRTGAAISRLVQHVINDHFDRSPRAQGIQGIRYKGKVVSGAPVSDIWRLKYPALVPCWKNGKLDGLSVEELFSLETFVVAQWDEKERDNGSRTISHPSMIRSQDIIVSPSDLPRFSHSQFRKFLETMDLIQIDKLDDLWLLRYSSTETGKFRKLEGSKSLWVVPALPNELNGLEVNLFGSNTDCKFIYAERSPLLHWIDDLIDAVKGQAAMIDAAAVKALINNVEYSRWNLRESIERWRRDPSVPTALRPPRSILGYGHYAGLCAVVGRVTVADAPIENPTQNH